MKKSFAWLCRFFYKRLARPFLFLFDSERVHGWMTNLGSRLGRQAASRNLLRAMLRFEDKTLAQTIDGIFFSNPLGLSAGFDYDACLTQILPSVGFGFGTIGTVTNQPYNGNPPPRLGRLVRSKSLMVNKGFRSAGIRSILKKLEHTKFDIPVGISIGKTNRPEIATQEEAIVDILEALRLIESSAIPFSYYELNISCPNLSGNVSFYEPERLDKLLGRVTGLGLSKPLWIKMPIEKRNEETRVMLDIIMRYPIRAVIFGNLQKNRHDPALDPVEVARFPQGNFSGKPTQKRSDELIRLAYRHCGKKLMIVGCGGVFNARDAYQKIKLGARLVQFITGLVFEGPQLPAEIARGLVELLKKDGFQNISDAVGKESGVNI